MPGTAHSRFPFSSGKEDKYVWYFQLSTDLMLVWKCSYYALFSRNLTQWVPSSLPTTPSLTDRRVCWKMLCFSSKFQYLKTYKNRHCALLLLNWLLLGHCIYFDKAKVISRSVLADCCHYFTRLIKVHHNLKDFRVSSIIYTDQFNCQNRKLTSCQNRTLPKLKIAKLLSCQFVSLRSWSEVPLFLFLTIL